MKKLRFANPGKTIRYLMCGEYGGKTGRCHFHSVIFNHLFLDQYDGINARASHELDKLWGNGLASVDSFTYEGAAYVAGYVTKKTNAQGPTGPIEEVYDEEGVLEYWASAPEYRRMSTNPGLGAEWILKPENYTRVYQNDYVEIAGYKYHPPAYYDKLYRRKEPKLWPAIAARRQKGATEYAKEWDQKRCASAETIIFDKLRSRSDSL